MLDIGTCLEASWDSQVHAGPGSGSPRSAHAGSHRVDGKMSDPTVNVAQPGHLPQMQAAVLRWGLGLAGHGVVQVIQGIVEQVQSRPTSEPVTCR